MNYLPYIAGAAALGLAARKRTTVASVNRALRDRPDIPGRLFRGTWGGQPYYYMGHTESDPSDYWYGQPQTHLNLHGGTISGMSIAQVIAAIKELME